MFQPSTSRYVPLQEIEVSPLHGGGRFEEVMHDDSSNVKELVHFTNVDEHQSLTPISESTIIEGVDANALKLPREDERFACVEFSPDWSLVVTVTSDGTFSAWDATNEWVLVDSKRLLNDGRTLKCIAFDPYIEEAVLLCFDSGEIFRTSLSGPATIDAPGSSQEQGMLKMELVYMCEGRSESRFDYFKFSLDRKIMVYYNLDGEFAAIQLQEQGGLKITLSKDFKLKQGPIICVFRQSILITAMLQSSEDHEPDDEQIRTLVWSKVDFENINKPVQLRGKGCLSNDGKYALISDLTIEHESRCCQIRAHLIENVKSSTNMKHSAFATRILRFTSNHPYLECLDRKKFEFLHVNDGDTKPLIAIHQTISVGSRLLFWDTNSDVVIYEIDLTLNKEARKFSEVKYCWSSDYKWLGVCSSGARMMGLVCARSGVFVWTAHCSHSSREDMGCASLRFDCSGTRLMIYLDKLVYLLEPPCLSKKPQRHPVHNNLLLNQTSRRYSDFEILEMAKEWPKQVLFNVLLAGQKAKPEYQHYLLDVAISSASKRLAMICEKYEGHCFLSILDYNKKSSWESLWLAVMSRWNQCFLANNISHLVKDIEEDQRRKGMSVFYYDNRETSNEHVVLFSSKDGMEMLDMDSDLKELSEWTELSNESCFSCTQSKDRLRVISLADKSVFIIDLNEQKIVKNVEYSFRLSQWWGSFLDEVKFFIYSHYDNFTSQESGKRHKQFLQERLRGLFDVADDGETILIGWDNERNRSLVITPDKSEEQFRIEWDEARESLYQCSMLTENGKWLGFIDYEKLRGGDIVVCVINTESNRQQRIWLGSNELLAKIPSESQPSTLNFFLQVDASQEKLTTLRLEEIGSRNKLKLFFVELVHDATCTQDHHSLLEDMTQPINLDKYGERDQPSQYNMSIGTMTNFQRVLIEEGEEMMEKVAKSALDNKIKVSDVYQFWREKEHSRATFLTHAQERRQTSLVHLYLRFIEDGLFTFHSASTMVKDSFFEMLFSYNELILPILKRNSLTYKAAEIMVPAQVFQSRTAGSNVVYTSNTLLEPEEHFVNVAIEDLQKLESRKHLGFTKNYKEGRKVVSCVSFHYIANACKVGLSGIIRKLLMLQVDSSIFKSVLIRATVTWKWEKLWKKRCLRQLYLYLAFLVFFTSYAVSIGISGDKLVHNKNIGLKISFLLLGAFIITIVFFSNECRQLRTYIKDGKEVFGSHWWGLKHYFLDSQWNIIELTSYFLVLALIPIFHCMYMIEIGPKEPLFVIVAIESLLTWFKLWYYAQPFDRTAALVLLISNVIQDCLPFLFLAVFVLVGFSVALYVLFQCVSGVSSTNSMGEGEEDLIYESFGSLGRSMSTLFYAMVGTFEPEVYYNHQSLSWLTTLLFVLYMALEMIVMLNMLIAIMGDTFDRVKSEEDIQIIIGRARYMDAYEASLSTRQIREVEKQIGKFIYVLTPKDSHYVMKKIGWKGRINVMEDNIQKAIDALEANVTKGIEQNRKVINDNKKKMENNLEQHFERVKEFSEMHKNKDQDILRSIIKKIEALEMKTNGPTSNMGHQAT